MSVTVPAKDEAGFIVSTLEALRAQLDFAGEPLDPDCYEVILLANNCSDRTYELATHYANCHPRFRLHPRTRHLPSPHAHVGTARKLMMDAASRRLPPHGIIATTDADTRVDRHWIAATLRAFERGAKAVGGRILAPHDPGRPCHYRKTYLQDVSYRMLRTRLESLIDPDENDPWPRHFQEYGPSMAVRVDAYQDCGGVPPLKCIEDVALGQALERVDVNFVHDPSVRVYTSARRSNRIEGVTFGHALDEWDRMKRENRHPLVFGLENCVRLYTWKKTLRDAFHGNKSVEAGELSELAGFLGMQPVEMQSLIDRAPTFGSLYQDVRQRIERTHSFSDATYERAIGDLRRFIRRYAARRPGGNAPDVLAGG